MICSSVVVRSVEPSPGCYLRSVPVLHIIVIIMIIVMPPVTPPSIQTMQGHGVTMNTSGVVCVCSIQGVAVKRFPHGIVELILHHPPLIVGEHLCPGSLPWLWEAVVSHNTPPTKLWSTSTGVSGVSAEGVIWPWLYLGLGSIATSHSFTLCSPWSGVVETHQVCSLVISAMGFRAVARVGGLASSARHTLSSIPATIMDCML